MRWNCWMTVLAGIAFGSAALAQEPPKYEVLKKMYDDAVGSLKAAQDTKSQLATKNEQLTRQVAELQKQLDAVTKDRDDLQRQVAEHAEKTFAMRSQLAAWQEFLKRYPMLHTRWRAFLDMELIKGGADAPALAEPAWPFRLQG